MRHPYRILKCVHIVRIFFIYILPTDYSYDRWGHEPSRGHTILPNFPRNCMKLKEFGCPWRGAWGIGYNAFQMSETLIKSHIYGNFRCFFRVFTCSALFRGRTFVQWNYNLQTKIFSSLHMHLSLCSQGDCIPVRTCIL